MKKLSLLICCVFSLSASGINQSYSQTIQSDYISAAEEKALEKKALEGDGLAAFRLANYASYGVISKEKKIAERYWVTIAAEDGLSAGSLQLGMFLYEEDSDPSSIVRAKFWLTKAKEQGQPMADFGLCLICRKANPALPECQLSPGVLPSRPSSDHE